MPIEDSMHRDLGRHLLSGGIHPNEVTRIIDELIAEGEAEISGYDDNGDRLIRLTAKGAQTAARLRRERND